MILKKICKMESKATKFMTSISLTNLKISNLLILFLIAINFLVSINIECLANEVIKPSIKTEAIILSNKFTVTDGDTIRDGKLRIRLYGLDAPELAQECKDAEGKNWKCGEVAKKKLQNLVKGKKVRCDIKSTDLYKRKVAICYAGEKDINRYMVEEGYAVAYLKYSHKYELDEEYAMNNNKGIWVGDFKEPEDYRKSKQKKSQESKQSRISAKKKPVNTSKSKSQKINRNAKSIFGVLDDNKKHNKKSIGKNKKYQKNSNTKNNKKSNLKKANNKNIKK